jgi:hypothetical protein
MKLSNYLPFILFLGGITLVVSCSKKEEISNIPEIEFISVTPTMVTQFQDSLIFRISYKDGDGDLGENIDTVYNVFLTDSRNNVAYKYRLQELAPLASNISIQGNVNIKLNGVGLLDENADQETASFSIYVKDRAGNSSNTVTSSVVTISK